MADINKVNGTDLGLKSCWSGLNDVLLGLLHQQGCVHSVAAVQAEAVVTEDTCIEDHIDDWYRYAMSQQHRQKQLSQKTPALMVI